MIDAAGQPGTLLLLGRTSEIGLAIARRYLLGGPLTVIVAARASSRRDAAADDLQRAGGLVQTIDFDATEPESHSGVIDGITVDIDVAVVAFGQLGEQDELQHDPTAAAALAQVNFVGAVSVGTALAERLQR